MAHGGYTLGTGKFTVPGGVSVHFYVRHGDTANDPQAAIHVGTKLQNRLVGETVGPGQQCYNYGLSKVLGHGASGLSMGGESNYYSVLVDMMEMAGPQADRGGRNWAPNVVTVRNRMLQSSSVTLESLVTQVKAGYPGITDFYVLACRAVFTSATMFSGGRMLKGGKSVRV